MQENTEEIITAFKKTKTKQIVSFFLLLAPVIIYPVLTSFKVFENSLYLLFLFPSIWGVLGIFFFINWRCPSCRRYLGGSFAYVSLTSCPHCGIHFIHVENNNAELMQTIDSTKLYPEFSYPKPRNVGKDGAFKNYLGRIIIYLSLCGYPLVRGFLSLIGPNPRPEAIFSNIIILAFVLLSIRVYTSISDHKIKRILSLGDPVTAKVELLRWQNAGRSRSIKVSYTYKGKKYERTISASRSFSPLSGDTIVLVVAPHDPSSAVIYTDCGYHIIAKSEG